MKLIPALECASGVTLQMFSLWNNLNRVKRASATNSVPKHRKINEFHNFPDVRLNNQMDQKLCYSLNSPQLAGPIEG